MVPSTVALAGVLISINGGKGLVAATSRSESTGRAQPVAAVGAIPDCESRVTGSPYIPVDSWIYPATLRLYTLGFLDQIYIDMRPWTRASLRHALEDTASRIADSDGGAAANEAGKIYTALNRELLFDTEETCAGSHGGAYIESTYFITRGISGTPLHDSFHLGSTIINDYARPYQDGFNTYLGASGYFTAGRYALYARGEFQDAPNAAGYSVTLVQTLAGIDRTVNPVTFLAYPNQSTIPAGPIATLARGRFLEAYASAQVLNHVISFGKADEWLGPGEGASMAYSNNAEAIYGLQINRIEPLFVPGLSRFTGPFRYEFLVGELHGHTLMPNPEYAGNPASQQNVINPGNPWVHLEKVSFRPSENLEFGFERTAFWGGKGHEPVTLHTFLRSFFSTTNVAAAVKNSTADPGARFASFDFSYRLPYVRNWLTLYTDGEVHDDISPIDSPRSASWRPGLYLSRVPGLPKLDMRAEAVTTDPPVSRSNGGEYMYWETIERQGYTNNGQLIGDWIGREDKGGQAWITYHLGGNEWIQSSYRHQKAAKDFIPGGTTLNDFGVQMVKRVGRDLEIRGEFGVEHWKIPIYLEGRNTVTTTTVQLTWFPRQRIDF